MQTDLTHPPAQPPGNQILAPQDWQRYQQAIRRAKEILGIAHLCLITPVGSLPKIQNDTGIGSLIGAAEFFDFATRLGFDTYQLDPAGKRKKDDASPYIGTVFSLDPLTGIDLAPLTTKAWGQILSPETLKRIVDKNPNPDGYKVAYRYIFDAQQQALQEAYENFKNGQTHSSQVLHTEFQAFLTENHDWLERDALYEALIQEYGNDYWPGWKGPQAKLDKHLYNPKNDTEVVAAQKRIVELQEKYRDVIGVYQFAQFVAAKQREDFKMFGEKRAFQTMADRQVAFSDRESWAYQKLFLSEWSLGVPPDMFSKRGQAWGFPVLDPEQIFNPDGSLGEAGQLLAHLYEKMFEENPGGLRIDHFVGLIDPWVYPAGTHKAMEGARLFSSPEHPVLGRYAVISEQDLDWEKSNYAEERVRPDALTPEVVDHYARIVDRIILPAAEKVARTTGKPVSIQCEDLGTLTNPVLAVMESRQLAGIAITQFVDPEKPDHMYRGRCVPELKWIAIGNHDTPTLSEWAEDLVRHPHQAWLHARLLAEDLEPDAEARHDWTETVMRNANLLAEAKWVELFSSPPGQVQVFFCGLAGTGAL